MEGHGHGQYATAQLVAGARAQCTADPVLKRLCNDPWAAAFCADDGARTLARQVKESNALPEYPLWIGARTAFFDSVVTDAVLRCGVSQVVILGAGFDTRSNRLGLAHRAAFFEIDTPQSQTYKLSILHGLVGYQINASIYLECDFEKQGFMDVLSACSSYDRSRPTLFLIEGVVYYLTEPAVRATLRAISTHAHCHSVVAFDYFSKQSVFGKDGRRGQDVLKGVREPMLFGLDHPLRLLAGEGYTYVVHHDFDEIVLNTTRSHHPMRFYRFQGLCVACVERPPVVPSPMTLLPFSKL